jgi:hypothetical protein
MKQNTIEMRAISMIRTNKLIAVTLLLSATTLFAGGGKKYGIAGCGLGSLVMGPTGNQILAATTNNYTVPSQLFGITSGTSNCADDGIAMIDKEKEFFATANYESLKQEMAQGTGENLMAMASLFGCQSEAFAASMKVHYGSIFPSAETDSDTMLVNMEAIIGNDSGLENACTEVN